MAWPGVDLVLNLGLAGLGQLFRLFRIGTEATEQLSRSRRNPRGLAERSAMVTATAAGQIEATALLDDQARKKGVRRAPPGSPPSTSSSTRWGCSSGPRSAR